MFGSGYDRAGSSRRSSSTIRTGRRRGGSRPRPPGRLPAPGFFASLVDVDAAEAVTEWADGDRRIHAGAGTSPATSTTTTACSSTLVGIGSSLTQPAIVDAPSTAIVWPVRSAASSESKNAATDAISSGWPRAERHRACGCPPLPRACERARRHRRVDATRADAVGAHAVASVLHRHQPGQGVDAALARGVTRAVAVALEAGGRRDRHDRPPVLDQVGQGVLDREERAGEVHAEHVQEVVELDLGQRA